MKSGIGTNDVYKPNLWYFEYLQFLESYFTPRKSRNSIEKNSLETSLLISTLNQMQAYFFMIDDMIEDRTLFRITMKSAIGQSLDFLCTNFGKKPNLDMFTMNQYNSIVKYKTSYCSFILPIIAAMQLAGIKDQEMFKEAKTILLEIGCLFQVQDDYLGSYGDFEICKNNNDVQEGKYTWFIVVALQRVTPEQRKILEMRIICRMLYRKLLY
ncbi:Farnesyl pyrophosphate synthase [Cyphomyrmex costatus]|uniref:Farnesyl pyrophosphate synthase n=1 Tax=Cyphomyrmex costatus TaxID=456900 RepID=A0A151IPK9_9HYME|nr:Farnesyl pyrophosphate synthase [Cyphomyrmex costatus]